MDKFEIVLSNKDGNITMSSVDIVEMINIFRKEEGIRTGKPFIELRHDSFMAKVPEVLGKYHAPKFFGTQKYGNNNSRKIYNFPKREACLMAMSYSYELQAIVYDRMTEAEEKLRRGSQNQLPNFNDPVIAARAWADEVEKNQVLENKINKDKPLVEMAKALMDLGDEEGKIRPTDFAKAVGGIYGVGRNNLYDLMRDMRIWNKDNVPYSRFVQGGYFLVRENRWYNKHNGMEGVNLNVWITPKGRQYLIGKLNNLFDTEEV